MSPAPFTKRRRDAPPGFFGVEAAGLRWLGAAPGGVPVVEVLAADDESITLARLAEATPAPAAAEELGRRLAATHRAGAPWWGSPPEGWAGDGFIGPLPLPHAGEPTFAGWGEFYARLRLAPYAERAARAETLAASDRDAVERVVEALLADTDAFGTDPGEPVARLHGDLWSGNVMWTAAGAVLIDPAAHGGHRETDLAMLALFGCPHLQRIVDAYDEAWPLTPGWRRRIGLHQLHPLLVHAALFGGAYGRQAGAAARRLLEG